ncbi:DUF4212 domain-containing protein [Lentisphaera profundi]|uniref:DUF4212 domain-containing protein n=1 Tax=Lentisphaera profundi TaxID=1658616 RepID=A0ABY7VWI6_9BACT|nr:DUF4212 domain-containing protein [Lentisphaera profundi]WDE98266.1 DUF4212 domain-containing protein [Lentisphaera profundi]
MSESKNNAAAHYKGSLKIVGSILIIWAFISFGCAIIFRTWMDANMPKIGNAPFGFWMAQQGAIIGFVILLLVYTYLMNKLDHKYGYGEED